jgi:hypothetical protein
MLFISISANAIFTFFPRITTATQATATAAA